MTQESNSKIKFRQKAVYKIFYQHTFKDSKKLKRVNKNGPYQTHTYSISENQR